MNENRLMQQVGAIFSVFMVFFYMGTGIYIAFFFDMSLIDKPVRVIMGSTFIFYGLYRAFVAYRKIRELFFTENSDE